MRPINPEGEKANPREEKPSYLRVLPHSSTPAILSKTRLRMRLWTKRIRFTRSARPRSYKDLILSWLSSHPLEELARVVLP